MRKIHVMVNGLPGNMAQTVVTHTLQDDRFDLLPYSLTGPEITDNRCRVASTDVQLIHPNIRDEEIGQIQAARGPFISLDFTLPAAVSENTAFYCRHRLPFVMGTTGGDRQALENAVTAADIAAVIAPNMAKQIVGFQAMMAYAAENFPDLFGGYHLDIKESHQKGKVDTSGTAKAMVGYFNRLGIPFSPDEIFKERDPAVQQKDWNIPEASLTGHGWHTYTLVSGDGTVRFEFTHNVNGRDIYARGALDGVAYLAQKIGEGAKGKVFTMIDVLKAA